MKQLPEYRTGRNFIRIGDIVRVRPRPGRRDGFEAKVRAILADERGEVTEIEVFGGPAGRHAIRTLRPERIERLAQTCHGEARTARR
jgi:hypothetical protein